MDILREAGYLVLLFFLFSVAGWCMEVILKYIQYHRFINRGFLIGPYCPIYGSGAVFITVAVRLLKGVDSSVGSTFLISFVLCGALEYFVGYYMEKRYHARWWDYSQKPMNLHGRIWIGNLILFGLGGVLIVDIINPVVFPLFYRISDRLLYILAACIVVVMVTDNVFSHFIMKLVKVNVESSEADNTEQIGQEIMLLMTNRSVFHSRLVKAYPEVTYYSDRIRQRRKEQEERMQQIRKELSEDYNLIKIGPLGMRDDIIQKQEQLILLLENESENGDNIQRLQAELDQARKDLDSQNKIFHIGQEKFF